MPWHGSVRASAGWRTRDSDTHARFVSARPRPSSRGRYGNRRSTLRSTATPQRRGGLGYDRAGGGARTRLVISEWELVCAQRRWRAHQQMECGAEVDARCLHGDRQRGHVGIVLRPAQQRRRHASARPYVSPPLALACATIGCARGGWVGGCRTVRDDATSRR